MFVRLTAEHVVVAVMLIVIIVVVVVFSANATRCEVAVACSPKLFSKLTNYDSKKGTGVPSCEACCVSFFCLFFFLPIEISSSSTR